MPTPRRKRPPHIRDFIPGIGGPTYVHGTVPTNEGRGSNTPGGYRGPGGEAFGPPAQTAPYGPPPKKKPKRRPTRPTPGSSSRRHDPQLN